MAAEDACEDAMASSPYPGIPFRVETIPADWGWDRTDEEVTEDMRRMVAELEAAEVAAAKEDGARDDEGITPVVEQESVNSSCFLPL